MANPVIRSITVTPSTVRPGDTAMVVIEAHDADAQVYTMTGSATDNGSNVGTKMATLTVSDLLKYGLTADDPQVQIVADLQLPNVFHVTVPPRASV